MLGFLIETRNISSYWFMGTLVIVYTKSSYDDIPPTYCVYILIHIFIAKFPTELVKLNLTLIFYQYILLLEKVIDSLGLL